MLFTQAGSLDPQEDTAVEVAKKIRRLGFDQQCVRAAAMRAPTPWQPYLDLDLLASNSLLEFTHCGTSVHRLREQTLTTSTPNRCLSV